MLVASARSTVAANGFLRRAAPARGLAAAARAPRSPTPPSSSFRGAFRRPAAMTFLSGLFGGGASRAAASAAACAPAAPPPAGLEAATFAGGCFWGIELAYQRVPSVARTAVGYTQGADPAPTYDAVCSGRTGHTEGVQVWFDPAKGSYEELLDVFLARTDPTTLNRQGNDAGTQYRSGIYFHSPAQEAAAAARLAEVQAQLDAGSYPRPTAGTKVAVELKAAETFFEAEEYHQQYLAKGGRGGRAQSAAKGCADAIRCYG